MRPLARLAHLVRQTWLSLVMRSSGDYWERRYRIGMTSGPGSAGRLAQFKAEVLNRFVQEHAVASVIEFGCGDGSQLELARYPRYLGIDVSPTAIGLCKRRFEGDATKSFSLQAEFARGEEASRADLTLSLDVIYHLLEDDVYYRHLDDVFAASRRWTIIYSSNSDAPVRARHVRHRPFLEHVRARHEDFVLIRKINNAYPQESFADFYVFERGHSSTPVMRA